MHEPNDRNEGMRQMSVMRLCVTCALNCVLYLECIHAFQVNNNNAIKKRNIKYSS